MSDRIVAVDIGGTHTRFSIATLDHARVVAIDDIVTLKTHDHDSLQDAWSAYAAHCGGTLPRAAGIAIASPVRGDVLKLTNSPWVIRPAEIADTLKLDHHVLVNDFGAIAHAVSQLGGDQLRHLCGPERDLEQSGVVSVIGPGTGLGMAQLIWTDGGYTVVETEGGHVDFAPLDAFEERMLAQLRATLGRVSVERIVSGPGIGNIYQALGGEDPTDDADLWTRAMANDDSLAASALDHFCRCLGAVAGDAALSHGASGVVIAGGIGLRLADMLPSSGFSQRFVAKGRFETMMRGIPVKIITHDQPGLLGAVAAFARRYRNH